MAASPWKSPASSDSFAEPMMAEFAETPADLETRYREVVRAHNQTRAMLDATSEAMVLVAPDAYVLTVNQPFTALFGVGAEAVVGRHFDELEPLVNRVFEDPDAFRALVGGTAIDAERRLQEIVRQRWPEERELQLFSSPVQNPDNSHLGRLYVFRDVTGERQADRAKSEFLRRVSHELRTPLTAMKGFVDFLLEGEAGPLNETQREYMDIVKQSTDALGSMINNLLDISRLESGRRELHLGPLDLTQHVHSAIQALSADFAARRHDVSDEVPPGLPAVWADAPAVSQILANLLDNALKYTPPGGRIVVTARAGPEDVRVEVRDSGVGLTPEDKAHVFNRFFRARNRLTQDIGGAGLGLAITLALVELQGGAITVESTPGEGSTFSFTLPLASTLHASGPTSEQ